MRRAGGDGPFDPSTAAGARAVSRLSIGDALRNQALSRPDAVAVVHPTGRLSYRELDATSNRLARALIDRGIGTGDRVAVLARNCVEYVLLQHAVAKLGAIMVSLNWRWQADELSHAVELVSPTIVFTSPEYHERASAAVVDAASRPEIVPFDRSDGAITAVPLDGYLPDPLGLDVDPERIVTILYTSGTTGRPKAAAMSHRAYVARAGRDAAVLGLSHRDAHIAWGPMYHMVSADYIFIMCLLGGAYIIVPGFDVDTINEHLHEWDLGWLVVMPGAIGQLVDRVRRDPRPPRAIRCLGAMADLIPPGQIAQATATLRAPFLNSFGLTESGLTTGSLIPVGATPSDLGKTFSAFFATRLVDPADPTRDVPDGTAGELLLRGPTLFSGYWNDAEATNAALADGWFHTGDLLVREADGRMNVVGRAKYMIKSGGENIYPAEIERVLLSHPEVSEACVVKRADEHWGEVPVAFVAAPRELTAEVLREYCRGSLAGYKLPRSIVHLELDRFPRNITGKVLREELETRARDLPAAGRAAPRGR